MLDKMKNMFKGKAKKDMTPKELATKNKEPWVSVLTTHVDKANPKNGFFELDWNEYFVQSLRLNGYRGATDEEVVDHWFSVLCNTIATEETPLANDNQIVKETKREDGKTEIS